LAKKIFGGLGANGEKILGGVKNPLFGKAPFNGPLIWNTWFGAPFNPNKENWGEIGWAKFIGVWKTRKFPNSLANIG